MWFLQAILFLCSVASALRFEIQATSLRGQPFCVRDFVAENQLVVVKIHSSGHTGDGQVLNFYIVDTAGNEYRRKKDFAGNVRVAFTSHSNSAFDVCFENTAVHRGRALFREIELDIEAGSAARDWNAVQAAEKLKPAEVELRRIEELTDELVDELNYLKRREERLRDTNESTNLRVKNFLVCCIFLLVALGVWQVNYLRNYFRAKHIL